MMYVLNINCTAITIIVLYLLKSNGRYLKKCVKTKVESFTRVLVTIAHFENY